MANKRIKDLSTTAAVTASDDFIAVDGATNGTRKLDAYSPTFGGNLTVSGATRISDGAAAAPALSFSSDTTKGLYNYGANEVGLAIAGGASLRFATTGIIRGGSVGAQLQLNASTGAIDLTAAGTNQNVTLTPSGTGTNVLNKGLSVLNTIGQFSGTSAPASGAGVEVGMLSTTGGLIFAYNRTTSAALPLSLQHAGGNLLIGTTTDTGEKLQVNGTGYFAGALIQLGNGSNDALYRVSASNGKSSDFGDDTTGGFVRANNSQSLRFITGGNIVLTLDSSANATFAGNIKTAAPSGGTAATWRLGTVASVSPTSPNRTIEVEIGGTTYYIHAKTTND